MIVCLWSAVYASLGWVPTVPINAYWDLSITGAARHGFGSFDVDTFVGTYLSLTASNMVLDMIVLGLAAPLLLGKGSNSRSRWALVTLFGVGSL